MKLRSRPQKHPWARLAAFTRGAIRMKPFCRVVRTIVIPINTSVMELQQTAEPIMSLIDARGRVITAGDSRLICNNDYRNPIPV